MHQSILTMSPDPFFCHHKNKWKKVVWQCGTKQGTMFIHVQANYSAIIVTSTSKMFRILLYFKVIAIYTVVTYIYISGT